MQLTSHICDHINRTSIPLKVFLNDMQKRKNKKQTKTMTTRKVEKCGEEKEVWIVCWGERNGRVPNPSLNLNKIKMSLKQHFKC